MIDQNLIMYFPMDDPEGNSVAFDYSKNREDATLGSGMFFSRDAVKGKSLALNGGVAVTDTVVPFSGDFTICLYVRPVGRRLGWLLNYSGLENYRECWVDVEPGRWIYLVIVKGSEYMNVYVDYTCVSSLTLPSGTPVGFSLNDELLSESSSMVDDVRMYDVAKDISQIMLENKNCSDVEYYVDGRNFKDFGVYVSSSKGLFGALERKEGYSEDWGMRHGSMRDMNYVRYKERSITLECFIEASSRSAFVEWMNYFYDQFRKRGKQRLCVEYAGSSKPLLYEVTMQAASDPEKEWGKYNTDMMVGTFSITLVEDNPVKMVLRHIYASQSQSTATLSLTSVYPVEIFWGDGNCETVRAKNGVSLSHQYSATGEYDIVIAGILEDVTAVTTNDIVVWQRLM